MKSLLVSGGNGYVGNYILKNSALRYPAVTHLSMSRRGELRHGDSIVHGLRNVEPVKGDCLDQATYPKELAECGAVIHCVGTLIEGKKWEQSYDAMNKQTAIRLAEKFNEIAGERGEKLPFVLMSSEKAPPFLNEYLTSKLEAEQFIFEQCPNLFGVTIRPGFIVDKDERAWSAPLAPVVDLISNLNDSIVKKTPLSKPLDFLFPAHSTKLATIAEVAIAAAHGEVETQIWNNELLLKYEAGENVK